MPTLKRRFDILFSEHKTTLNAQQREARVTYHSLKIQKHIHRKKKSSKAFDKTPDSALKLLNGSFCKKNKDLRPNLNMCSHSP